MDTDFSSTKLNTHKFFDFPAPIAIPNLNAIEIKVDADSKLVKKLNMIDRKLDKLLRMQKQKSKSKQTKHDGYELV